MQYSVMSGFGVVSLKVFWPTVTVIYYHHHHHHQPYHLNFRSEHINYVSLLRLCGVRNFCVTCLGSNKYNMD
jgi:hypothetical protein